MLKRDEIKACLNGEIIAQIPAIYFWMDGKFIDKYKDEVVKMKSFFCDDYLQTFPIFKKNAKEPDDLAENEFTNEWGSRFASSPDGVGSHPSNPIINNLDEWYEYKEKYIPTFDKSTFSQNVIKTRKENPDKYIITPSNSIMPETPVSNVWYLFEAIKEFSTK